MLACVFCCWNCLINKISRCVYCLRWISWKFRENLHFLPYSVCLLRIKFNSDYFGGKQEQKMMKKHMINSSNKPSLAGVWWFPMRHLYTIWRSKQLKNGNKEISRNHPSSTHSELILYHIAFHSRKVDEIEFDMCSRVSSFVVWRNIFTMFSDLHSIVMSKFENERYTL